MDLILSLSAAVLVVSLLLVAAAGSWASIGNRFGLVLGPSKLYIFGIVGV